MTNKLNYRKYCTPYDSVKLNLMVLIVPYLFSFALILVYMLLASSANQEYEEFLENNVVEKINLVFLQLVALGLFFYFIKKQKINFKIACKLNKKISIKNMLLIVILGVLFVYLTSPFLEIFEQGLISIGVDLTSDVGLDFSNAFDIIFAILFLGILPGFVEELIFRGVILQGLRPYGKWFAILISALLFMLFHGNLQQTIYQFAYGVLAGYLVILTGSLWASILIHIFNNVFIIMITVINTASNSTGEYNDITFGFILTAIGFLVVLFIAIYYLSKFIKKNVNYENKIQTNTFENSEYENVLQDLNYQLLYKDANVKDEINTIKIHANDYIEPSEKLKITEFRNNRPVRYLLWVGIIGAILLVLLNSFS